MKSVLRVIFYCVAIQLIITPFLWSQSDRGRISGTVTDATGGIVAGVLVTATSQDTKVQTTAISNNVGQYSLLNLPIGRYSVTFKKEGFGSFNRDGISVALAQLIRLDVVLELGTVAESVTVNGDTDILETETPEVGTRMKSLVVTNLPLSISGGRSLENFAYAVTPGVEGNNWTSYIAGSSAFTKEVLIDGTSAVVQIGGHIGETSPTMEAVQEFTVETSGIRAEDGRTGGGVFKFTLKSGTNDFHGSGFGFMRNEVLNANTWQNNYLAASNPSSKDEFKRPMDRQNDYGFSAGGPIIKNHTFIFGAFEQYRQQRYVLGPFDRTVPTPAFLDGDFSALLDKTNQLGTDRAGNPIYKGAILDPSTGLVFPGNVIPSNRISTVSRRITDIFRTSYQPMLAGALVNNSAITRQNDPWFHQTQLTFKVDQNFSEKSKLSGSVIWTERPRILVDSGGIWDPKDPNREGGPLSRTRMQEVTGRSIRLSHSYTFTPTLLNVASFSFGRYRNPSLATASDGDWPQQLGFNDTGAGNFPEINFGRAVNGVGTSEIGYGASGYYVSNAYIARDDLTWAKGRHSIKTGGEIRWMQLNSHAGLPALHFNFNNSQTGAPNQPWANEVGFGFASFLLGEVESASQATPFDLYGRRKTYSLYVQDDFKLNPKLTLTMDLRWEATGPFTEKYGHWANFDETAINPKLGIPGALVYAKDGKNSFEKQRDWKEFGPHVGVAYQLAPKAVVRAAYGIFYSPIGLNYWLGVPYGFAPGFRGTNEVLPHSDLSPAFNWDGGYPGSFVPGTLDPTHTQYGMVNVNPRSLFAGYIQQWNAGTELELSQNLRLDVTYLANKGSRLQSGDLERNQPDSASLTRLLQSGMEWNWVYDPASAAAAGVHYPYPGFSNFAFMALAPFPQVAETYGPLYHVGSPLGASDYRSLQIAVVKREGHGLAANVSYTYSRARGDVPTGFQETWSAGPLQDVTKLSQEAMTVLPYDQTHVFKGYFSWDLPFGSGQAYVSSSKGALNALVGGWTLSSSFRYDSGFPLRIVSNYWYPGWETIYINVNPKGSFGRKFDSRNFDAGDPAAAGNLYFDPSSFSNPTYGEFGTAPGYLSQVHGFGGAYENVGVMKSFQFAERYKLQFRFEFYNIFNRHYFSDPNSDIGNAALFGHVTSTTGSPREGQFGMRFQW